MASLEFDRRHYPSVCDPPPGSIVGVLHPGIDGPGSYTIRFLDADRGDRLVAECTVESPDGDDVPVDCPHEEREAHDPFQRNLRVKINRQRPGAPLPVCLRAGES